MAVDRTVQHTGRRNTDERPGPFDIEREDVVLARVVDASVPIQSLGSGPAIGEGGLAPVPNASTASGPWAPPAAETGPGDAGGYEGPYPEDVEGFREVPPSVGTLRADTPEWAGPVGGRRRRLPAFTMARRGFEPAEVEMYLAQQDSTLAAAVERADIAERQLAESLAQLADARDQVKALQDLQRSEPPASIQALGGRVADILETAWQAAEELRAEAAGAAERARAEADDVVRAAEAEARAKAADIVAEAERHRRVVMEELTSRRAEHDADVARLTGERQSALKDLERLHSALQRALGPQAARDEVVPGGPAAVEAGRWSGAVPGASAERAGAPAPPSSGAFDGGSYLGSGYGTGSPPSGYESGGPASGYGSGGYGSGGYGGGELGSSEFGGNGFGGTEFGGTGFGGAGFGGSEFARGPGAAQRPDGPAPAAGGGATAAVGTGDVEGGTAVADAEPVDGPPDQSGSPAPGLFG